MKILQVAFLLLFNRDCKYVLRQSVSSYYTLGQNVSPHLLLFEGRLFGVGTYFN